MAGRCPVGREGGAKNGIRLLSVEQLGGCRSFARVPKGSEENAMGMGGFTPLVFNLFSLVAGAGFPFPSKWGATRGEESRGSDPGGNLGEKWEGRIIGDRMI